MNLIKKNHYVLMSLLLLFKTCVIQSAARIKASEEEVPKQSSELDLKLIEELRSKNIEGVRKLLDLKANVNAADKEGWPPLLTASKEEGCIDLAKILINAGANLNLGSKEGRTAIIMAATWDQYKTLKYLIEVGANVEASDIYGNTALTEAVYNDRKKIVKLLLYAGAGLGKKKNGITALEVSHICITSRTEKGKKVMHEITKLLEDEPKRRIKAINQWLKSNKSIKAKNINEKIKEITQATGYALLPDLAQLISEYNIEYTDIPLADRLADLEKSENINFGGLNTARELVGW